MEKAKIEDLKNEVPSQIIGYLFIEPQSIKKLAINIYGKNKENVRKGITDWLKRFLASGWIEQKSLFTKEKFYQIKQNPFFEWVDNDSRFNDTEKRYLKFMIDTFLIERLKDSKAYTNITKVFENTLINAMTIKWTYSLFGFDPSFRLIVKIAKQVEKSGDYYIPSEIEAINKKMFNELKVGQGMIDLTFIFSSIIMPKHLPSKMGIGYL